MVLQFYQKTANCSRENHGTIVSMVIYGLAGQYCNYCHKQLGKAVDACSSLTACIVPSGTMKISQKGKCIQLSTNSPLSYSIIFFLIFTLLSSLCSLGINPVKCTSRKIFSWTGNCFTWLFSVLPRSFWVSRCPTCQTLTLFPEHPESY